MEMEARSVVGALRGFGRPADDYQPLAAYKEPTKKQKHAHQGAKDAQEKRRLLDELGRIHDRERAIQRRLEAITDASG